MKVSIFTPTHNPKYLEELYDSIREQDFYEWIIVPNNTSERIPIGGDHRLKVYPCDSNRGYIGELKKFAAAQCSGDIILEVDHDDLLTPDAIDEVKKAFEDPSVGFVYSNHCEFKEGFKPGVRFNAAHGWKWKPFSWNGKNGLDEVVAFPPTPASVSRIWYAPNHLRAWRREVYEKVGGHNPDLKILDDQDLMARTYMATKMKHIEKCLYMYRIDGGNSWLKFNKEIQDGVMPMYDKNILDMAIHWSRQNNLRAVDLGGAFNADNRLECIDLATGYDLRGKFPFDDNSVGVIRANDILEHLPDKLHTIKEIYRVLSPGGYLFAMTPSALSQGAYQDPTHVAYYVENSFKYYTEERFAKYIGTPVRFQAMRLYTTRANQDGVSWVVFHALALKGQEEVPGVVQV